MKLGPISIRKHPRKHILTIRVKNWLTTLELDEDYDFIVVVADYGNPIDGYCNAWCIYFSKAVRMFRNG